MPILESNIRNPLEISLPQKRLKNGKALFFLEQTAHFNLSIEHVHGQRI